MLTQQRRQLILERLEQDGQIVAKTLAHNLNLSEDTIRRDLRELAKEGLLQRVHGGALPASSATADIHTRGSIATSSKRALARAASSMIQDGQIVILDGGTTTLQLAKCLPKTLHATVVTHSPTIAVELANHPSIEVVLIGGKLDKHSVVTVGTAALEALSHIRADLYFMGVTGVHPEAGLSTGNLEEAYMKRALSTHAAETLVMASEEKLGVASAYMIMPTTEISGLIVNTLDNAATSVYTSLGVTVTQVETSRT
ncbi:MAG: DeoR/GlpR family DNA-binding transcription regulator [Deinococcota bacterium]